MSASRRTGTIKPGLGVHGDADVIIFLEDDFLRGFIEAGVEDGMFLERVHDGLKHKGGDREADALAFRRLRRISSVSASRDERSASSNW